MKIDKTVKKISLLIWIFFILIFLVILSGRIISAQLLKGSQWDKYYTIITSSGSSVDNFFAEENIKDYLSFNNSYVNYNNISSMDEISLKELQARFDLLDPRYDYYLKNIGSLFRGVGEKRSFDLVYAGKENLSLLNLYGRLLKRFNGEAIEWSISGFNLSSLSSLQLDDSRADGQHKKTASNAKLRKYWPGFKFTPVEQGKSPIEI